MTEMIEKRTPFHIEDTQVIKGLAILILLTLHLFGRREPAWALFSYNPDWMLDGKPLITALISAGCGKVCVDLFVILSGFGLNHSFRRRAADSQSMIDALKYTGKKILKLLMNFWCVYLLVGGLFVLVGKINLIEIYGTGFQGVKAALIDFLGLRDLLFEWAKTGTMNATWWFMSAIIVLYIFFPVLRSIVAGKYKLIPLLLFSLINIYAPYATYRQFSTGVFFYLTAFYFGMLCSELNVLDWLKNLGKRYYWERVAGAVIVVVFMHRFTYLDRYRGEPFLAVALLALFFVLFIEPNAVFNRKVIRKILVTLGEHSSNIFMFHAFFFLNFQNETYFLRNPLLILLSFTISMTMFSIVLEYLKKILGYYKLEKMIG